MTETTRYLRTAAAAEYIGVAKSTLEKLRLTGGGPIFNKLGRTVIYDRDDLDAWVASRLSALPWVVAGGWHSGNRDMRISAFLRCLPFLRLLCAFGHFVLVSVGIWDEP